MTEAPTLSIDAMSGDAGPLPVITGLARLARDEPDCRFLVFGDGPTLEKLMRRRRAQPLAGRVEIRHTSDTVRMDDVPSRTLRTRRGSSMWAAIDAVRDGEARVAVSCGNTGAMLAMAMLLLRKAPGIDRPAIAVHWPASQPHGFNTVLDVGADLRAGPRTLVQYAVLGAEYARLSLGIERPRVGLLNIGTEPQKGHADLRVAVEALADAAGAPGARLRSVGFVEGTDIGGDTADVIVTDGFTGNIALKTAEGTAAFIRQGLKDAFSHSPLSRIGQLFAVTSLRRLSRRIDPRRVNGGVFLGLNGTLVKSHGRADAVGVDAAVRLALALAREDYDAAVAREIARLDLGHLPVAPLAETPAHHRLAPDGPALDRAAPDGDTADGARGGDAGQAAAEAPGRGTEGQAATGAAEEAPATRTAEGPR